MKTLTTLFFAALLGTSSLFAQGSEGEMGQEFKQALIHLSKEMVEVAQSVKSVAGAEAAEPRIEAAMNSFANMINNLTNSIDGMTIKELTLLQDLEHIEEDPEVKKWGEKAEVAMNKLQENYPEAAARIEELADKHSGKLQNALAGLMTKAMELQGVADEEEHYHDHSDHSHNHHSEFEESSVAADFKNVMIDMSKQMIEVSEEVKSVADAEAAEPKIEAAMNTFASWIDNLTNSIDDMTVKDLMALKDMQRVNDDPEVKEWGEKVEAAMKRLEIDYPEAAAKVKELGEKHSNKLQAAMMRLTSKTVQMQGAEMQAPKE